MRGGDRRFAYRLACRLGFPNIDRMLQMMSWRQFLEWKAFADLEPFEDERADFNAAYIVQALLRDGRVLGDYLLPFGDSRWGAKAAEPRQTVAYQEMLIDAWISGSNAILSRGKN